MSGEQKNRVSRICELIIKLKSLRWNVQSHLVALPPSARRPAISREKRGRYLVDEIEVEDILRRLKPRIERAEHHLARLAPQIKTNTIDALKVGLV